MEKKDRKMRLGEKGPFIFAAAGMFPIILSNIKFSWAIWRVTRINLLAVLIVLSAFSVFFQIYSFFSLFKKILPMELTLLDFINIVITNTIAKRNLVE